MSEAELERRHDFISLSDAEIRDLIAPAFGSNALTNSTPLSGGRINSNYALHLNSGPARAVLRLYARGQDIGHLERDLLQELGDRIPVPTVLLDGSDAPAPFLVLSWIEGRTLDHALAASASDPIILGTQAGKALASIHEVTFPTTGFLGKNLHVEKPFAQGSRSFLSFVLPALQKRAGERLGTKRKAELKNFAQWAAPLLDPLPDKACLIHSDFNPPNLMIHDGQLSGVLDWEFAHAGNPLTDIANMLRHRAYQLPEFDEAFISAYEAAAGPLPNNWQSLSRILDLMSQIEMLGAPEERPGIFKWATDRIAETIAFVEQNMSTG